MVYKDFMSKTDDVVWLAYQLKNKLGSKISINKFGLYKEVLEGRYLLEGYDRGIDFSVLYSDKEFLRVGVGEIGTSLSSYEDKVFVLNELKNAISTIIRDGVSLGEPTLFYNTICDEYKIPNLEYDYADKEETIKAFQNNTIFDDGEVPHDLIVFDSVKESEEIVIVKDYPHIKPDTQSRYSISIHALLKNKCNIDEKELRNVIIENLDELFDGDNTLLVYYNDISYVVSYIKNALSLTEERVLDITIIKDKKDITIIKDKKDITIIKDKKDIKCIKYIEGTLVCYDCRCEFGECIMNTSYSKKDGIKFETKCDVGAYDLIEDIVRNELQNINGLKNISEQYNIRTNNNLLKLVRRIGNK